MTVIIISLWLFLFGAMVSANKEDKCNKEEFKTADEAIKKCEVKK